MAVGISPKHCNWKKNGYSVNAAHTHTYTPTNTYTKRTGAQTHTHTYTHAHTHRHTYINNWVYSLTLAWCYAYRELKTTTIGYHAKMNDPKNLNTVHIHTYFILCTVSNTRILYSFTNCFYSGLRVAWALKMRAVLFKSIAKGTFGLKL